MRRLFDWIDRCFCFFGWHHWDMAGGHCTDCGACDLSMGPHRFCGWREPK